MNQIAHIQSMDENDFSGSSGQTLPAVDKVSNRSSSGKESNTHWESVFNDYPGSGEDDYLFRGEMPKTLHWSIPWSDLMMTMFIFFAVMYVYHASSKQAPFPEAYSEQVDHPVAVPWTVNEKALEPEEDNIRKIYDLSREALRVDELRALSSIDLVPDKAVRIMLTGDLLFDTGKANLKEEAKSSLRKIGEVLKQTPYTVNLVGHTDDLPINTEQFPSNWELSTARACQVARFLIEEMNIPATKFFISGHSFYQPIRPNDTAINRAVNRRVEIIITKEKPYAVIHGIDKEETIDEGRF